MLIITYNIINEYIYQTVNLKQILISNIEKEMKNLFDLRLQSSRPLRPPLNRIVSHKLKNYVNTVFCVDILI